MGGYTMSIVSTADLKLQDTYRHLIGGEWVVSSSRQTLETVNPATEEVLARFQAGNGEDIDAAVTAARRAFPNWRRTTVTERARILNAIADIIETNKEDFARIETLDNGKPIRESRNVDIPLSVDHFRYFASVIRAEENTSARLNDTDQSYNYAEPLGVVGQIIPWNFPLMMAAWKIAPALAAGNCVVLKPAEQTPLSVLELGQRIQHLLPPGVLNIVTGDGPGAGAPLVAHREVDKIAFTGSTEVGRLIAEEAGKRMTPVTLELGGKSPNIVFPDANLPRAMEGLVLALALNQGEVCTCGSRALVHTDVYDKVRQGLKARFERIRVGDPLDETTVMGAQVSREQFDTINSYLQHAHHDRGIKIVCGGQPVNRKGYFIQPTIVETDNTTKLDQEEIFGPVLTLMRFRDEAEAVAMANDTPYGLGAGLWTRDVNRIHRMTREIQAGRIWVNTYHAYPAHAPFGGYKDSGRGRETHKMMLDAYRQNKNVIISHDENETGLFPI
jgi:acyl-CoA reductase-like NAD-dependent aldehyde dehydrogenase